MNKDTKKLGLFALSAIVAANIMGSGIALLPASFAAIGSITIISWIIALLGALSLAFVFSRLGLLYPKTGGPVAYAGDLSSILGYQTGLLYWLANWIGNLAIAVTGIEYLSLFYTPLMDPIVGGIAVIIIVWFFTFINFFGADKVGRIVFVTVILLLIPVVGTALFGWLHFSSEQFIANWNVSGETSFKAAFSGVILAVWSFIGLESASVSAGIVDNPKRTVPVATMIGTSIAAIAYISSTTAISGMFPANEIAKSGAPFAVAFGAVVGNWVKPWVSIFTSVACLASLGSWMMIVGQAGIAAADKGTLPSIFGKKTDSGIPKSALIINSILMTILMIIIMFVSYVKHQTATQSFSEIVSIAVLLTILPYFYSCIFMLKKEDINKKNIFHILAALLACGLCFIALAGAEPWELIGTVIVSFMCFIFYAFKQKNQKIKEEGTK